MNIIAVALLSLILAGCRYASANQEVFDASPQVNLRWSWEVNFNYCTNDSTNTSTWLFVPTSSEFLLMTNANETNPNNTLSLLVKPKLDTFKDLSELQLTVLIERFEEYFAWTNMTMQFKFSSEAGGAFPTELQTVESNTHKKFFTRTDEVYECESKIPIPMGSHVTVMFSNMTFQAFEAESNPPAERLREVCPRDFKSNIPIAILTGCSLLLIFVVSGSIFGVSVLLERRKSKQN